MRIVDAYRPVRIEPDSGVKTDVRRRADDGLEPGEEPVVTGTLFFGVLLLAVIFGIWMIMYVTLLSR